MARCTRCNKFMLTGNGMCKACLEKTLLEEREIRRKENLERAAENNRRGAVFGNRERQERSGNSTPHSLESDSSVEIAAPGKESDLNPEELKRIQETYDKAYDLFESDDPEKMGQAIPMIKEAAQKGLAIAQAQLGAMYTYGRGIQRNLQLGYNWTKAAADQDYPLAIANLGAHYLNGIYVEKDIPKAIQLYKSAASLGDDLAAYTLGRIYKDGKIAKADPAAARKYFLIGIRNGSKDAFMCLVNDEYEDKSGRDACRQIMAEEFDAFFSLIKNNIPVQDVLIPQNELNPIITAKRNQQYIKANRMYFDLTLRYNALSSNVVHAWTKVLGGAGDTRDLIRLGNYMLEADVMRNDEYAWANLEANVKLIESAINHCDLTAIKERLTDIAGNVPISTEEIDVGPEIQNKIDLARKKAEENKRIAEEEKRRAAVERREREEDAKVMEEDENRRKSQAFLRAMETAEGRERVAAFHTKVRGMNFRNDDGSDRRTLIKQSISKGNLQNGSILRLIHDSEDPDDPNRILVNALYGKTIGVLSKEISAKIAPDLEKGSFYKATVSEITGIPGTPAFSLEVLIEKFAAMEYSMEDAKKDYQEGKMFYDNYNYNLALPYLTKSAEFGFAQSQYLLGKCYERGSGVTKNVSLANAWYQKAAEQGNTTAQVELAINIQSGDGAEKDPQKALRMLKDAAAKDDSDAYNSLGYTYEHGIGVPQDNEVAFSYYQLAAELGNVQGAFNTGMALLIGRGVARDPVEAAYWNKMAAENGYANAQFNLGMQYLKGDGVTQDPYEGWKWIGEAAEQGYPRALEKMEEADVMF